MFREKKTGRECDKVEFAVWSIHLHLFVVFEQADQCIAIPVVDVASSILTHDRKELASLATAAIFGQTNKGSSPALSCLIVIRFRTIIESAASES